MLETVSVVDNVGVEEGISEDEDDASFADVDILIVDTATAAILAGGLFTNVGISVVDSFRFLFSSHLSHFLPFFHYPFVFLYFVAVSRWCCISLQI